MKLPQRTNRWFHPRDLAYFVREELHRNLDDLLISWGVLAGDLFLQHYGFCPHVLTNYNPPNRISCTVLAHLLKQQPSAHWLPTSVPPTDHLARFALSTLPGCKTVLVSHNAWVHPLARGHGIAPFLHRIKDQIARDLGAGALLATVRGDNAAQARVMEKVGMTRVTCLSTRQSPTLGLYLKPFLPEQPDSK